MRDLSEYYQLKSKASRDTFTEIDARFPTMFFSVHRLETPKAILGLKVGQGRAGQGRAGRRVRCGVSVWWLREDEWRGCELVLDLAVAVHTSLFFPLCSGVPVP